ncbi:uncharacterized protein RJT21DRAFT_28578 [Scheffersomyces amazonensis]|uniref:uncharacterized protein n=1 Tax=Scheffersomyces amazonensis TaxID=1078765 RepID=UPI00315D1F09
MTANTSYFEPSVSGTGSTSSGDSSAPLLLSFWQSNSDTDNLSSNNSNSTTNNTTNNNYSTILPSSTSTILHKSYSTSTTGNNISCNEMLTRNNSETLIGTKKTRSQSIMNINAPSYYPSYNSSTSSTLGSGVANLNTNINYSSYSNHADFETSPLSNPALPNNSKYMFGSTNSTTNTQSSQLDYGYYSNSLIPNSSSIAENLYNDSQTSQQQSFQLNLQQQHQQMAQQSQSSQSRPNVQQHYQVQGNQSQNQQYGSRSYESLKEDYKQLKVDLILKNQIIKNLTDQLNLISKLKTKALHEIMNNNTNTSTNNNNSNTGNNNSNNNVLKVSKNHYQLFQDLSRTLQEKTIELEETKTRLEAVLVGLSISNQEGSGNSNIINQGKYDPQEISHKIVNKLQVLSNENDTLMKLISFGNKSSLLIELGLLKRENNLLKEKLQKYEN